MADLKRKKHIAIRIEFRTFLGLFKALSRIYKNAREGKQEEQHKSDLYNLHYFYDFIEEFDYSDKLIGGKWCHVMPSKLNKEKKD